MAFDREALTWFAHRTSAACALMHAWSEPCWTEGREAIEHVFALDRTGHFLKGHRGLLPNLWERQITEGLKSLLLEQPSRTLERCQALLDALEGDNSCRLDAVDEVTADASDRIDLAIYARSGATRRYIIIEAKIDHTLSERQLKTYQNRTTKRDPLARRHLWVVAPKTNANIVRVLRKSTLSEWRFMTWRRLLLNWQRALPDNPGQDVSFFFAEIWKRSGGR